MKLKSYIVFVAWLLLASAAGAQNWYELGHFPGPARDDAVAFTIGQHGYVGTGLATGWFTTQDFWKFDFNNANWSPVNPFPGSPRQYASAFAIGQQGYVLTGLDSGGVYCGDLYAYDASSGTWSQRASLPGPGRSGAVAFAIGDTGYVTGGRDSSGNYLSDTWAYIPQNNSWVQLNDFPGGGRWRGSGFALNGKGYAGFGADSTGTLHRDWWEFDPASGNWSAFDTFPGVSRYYAAAAASTLMGFAGGGIDSAGQVLKDFYRLNTSLSNQWLPGIPDFSPLPRKGATGMAYQWSIYLTNGINGFNVRLNEHWQYIFGSGVVGNDADAVLLFPNPATTWIVVTLPPGKTVVDVGVYDQTGKIITREMPNDISAWTAGLYVLMVRFESGEAMYSKFLIAR